MSLKKKIETLLVIGHDLERENQALRARMLADAQNREIDIAKVVLTLFANAIENVDLPDDFMICGGTLTASGRQTALNLRMGNLRDVSRAIKKLIPPTQAGA